ncbi:MAG: hypothetical protein FWF08_02640 [Oscillospiraceae bacterium]|nr:hypothetical protein [Oscillospiraceae bacterium]
MPQKYKLRRSKSYIISAIISYPFNFILSFGATFIFRWDSYKKTPSLFFDELVDEFADSEYKIFIYLLIIIFLLAFIAWLFEIFNIIFFNKKYIYDNYIRLFYSLQSFGKKFNINDFELDFKINDDSISKFCLPKKEKENTAAIIYNKKKKKICICLNEIDKLREWYKYGT